MNESADRIRRIARAGAALVVALAATTIVVLADNEGVGAAVRGTAPWAIAGALALAVVSAFAEGSVLAILLGDVRPSRIFRMTRAYLAGGFVGSVTPYALGGGPTWVWALANEGIDVGEAAALVTGRSIVTAAFFGLMSVVAAVFAAGVSRLARGFVLALLVPVAVVGVLVLLARRPEATGASLARLLRWLARVLHAHALVRASDDAPAAVVRFAEALLDLLRHRPWQLLSALLAVAVSRASQLAAIPLLLLAQGYRMPAASVVPALLLLWAVSSVSPAPSGEGVAQAMLVAVFGPLASRHGAAAAALVWRASVHYPLFLAGGLLFARLVRGKESTAMARLSLEGADEPS